MRTGGGFDSTGARTARSFERGGLLPSRIARELPIASELLGSCVRSRSLSGEVTILQIASLTDGADHE
jgi:hypothetical protein